MEQRAPRDVRMRLVEVVGRDVIAADAVTLYLAAPGTRQAPASYVPGQHTTLALPVGGNILYRTYSLCSDGQTSRPWEIAVKRQHGGAVSTFLCEQAQIGTIVRASKPEGAFTLPRPLRPDMPLVFVAAGSGIAPIYGILRSLARLAPSARPRVQLHYASSSYADALFADELDGLDPPHRWLHSWHYLADEGGELSAPAVLRETAPLTTGAHWYVCGPGSLKRDMVEALAQVRVPARNIHAEVFGNEVDLLPTVADSAPMVSRIRLADSGAVLETRPGETLLAALERHDYAPPYDCRAGTCGVCRLRVVAGHVRNPDAGDLTPAERAAGYVLACVAQPLGEVTLATAEPRGTEGLRVRSGSRTALTLTLRVWGAAAAIALYAGAVHLAQSASQAVHQTSAGTAPATPQPTPKSGTGTSSITTTPTLKVPTTTTGVS
jgi:ring-1,2-phenylacetyl-CoA epoxidase subunit PaaE